jgi:hypothetical protein
MEALKPLRILIRKSIKTLLTQLKATKEKRFYFGKVKKETMQDAICGESFSRQDGW